MNGLKITRAESTGGATKTTSWQVFFPNQIQVVLEQERLISSTSFYGEEDYSLLETKKKNPASSQEAICSVLRVAMRTSFPLPTNAAAESWMWCLRQEQSAVTESAVNSVGVGGEKTNPTDSTARSPLG